MSNFQIGIFSCILIVLILFAAFFSCAETAIMAVNRYRLRHKAQMKKKSAIRLLHLLKRPDRLLGAILIGNTFANMLASALATLIAAHFWGDNGAVLAAIAMTFIVLIFAEITPKTLAALYPDQVARWVVYPIQLVMQILHPIVRLANAISNSLLKLFRVRITHYSLEPLSREELRSIVYDTTGKMPRRYQNMLLTILDLNKLDVDDVMIPQHEMTGIDIELPWEKILDQINKTRQEWVLFYRETINQIIGVLYIRDLARVFLAKKPFDKEMLQLCMQSPYFVPEGTSLNLQLGYFQQSKDKIAFVVDEYGEMKGMLTLNDILEEIVGDFTTSVATNINRITKQVDGSYLVEGALTIREFNRVTGFELPLSGPRTINGMIVEYIEALPRAGVAVLIADYPIEIIQVKDNRVKLAHVFPKITVT